MNGISVLICEFNPLHSGHKYILEKLCETNDVCVCIMSGNFVQRGESAIIDKYSRAAAALECGADLVLELPFPWCSAPAEFFSLGAVSIAKALNATRIVFGSECGDISKLKKAAVLCDKESFKQAIEAEYRNSTGYATARYSAALKVMPEVADVFSSSNDMLATEYLRCAEKYEYFPIFEAVLRKSGENFFSASDIRDILFSNKNVDFTPDTTPEFNLLKKEALPPQRFFDIVHTIFRLKKNDPLSFDHKSGILKRIASAAQKSSNGSEMLRCASTKKYTDARIRRAALMSCLSVSDSMLSSAPRFSVLLGANKRGTSLLSKYKGNLTVITKPSALPSDEPSIKTQYELQKKADELYAFCKGYENAYYLKKSPVIIR